MIQLGPFVLKHPIGKGGMGEIWAAEHQSQGVPAAVKVLTVSRAQHEGFSAAFRKEVRAVAGLDHPNIVVVYDHGEVSERAAENSDERMVAGTPYLAMELVPGGSLADLRGTIDWPRLREVLIDLLGALAHAHSRGVIHRDIKPGNVLVRDDGTIKLTDFGLAHATTGGASTADVGDPARRGGTPAYMAPEQFQGAWRDFGPWTDLYSVGCLAWSMATGRPPFTGTNWVEVMHAHLTQAPPKLVTRQPMPDEFEDWLAKLLRKHGSHRFRRASDAAWSLLRLPEVPPERPARPVAEVSAPPLDPRAVRTTLFWTAQDFPDRAHLTPDRPRTNPDTLTFEPPPIPSDWRKMERGRPHLLLGAGLGLYGLRSVALVGRDPERDSLWDTLRSVAHDRQTRLIWMHGPVGCGKSRLAEWLCERATEVGAATVLKATHEPVPESVSGISRMVAQYLGCVGLAVEACEERVKEMLLADGITDDYEWRALVELVAPDTVDRPVRLTSPRQRHLLIERLLERMTFERPVVLRLEDAHWSTEAIDLASHLLQHAQRLPLLLLLTSRDGTPHAAMHARLRELVDRDRAQEMAVGPLEALHASALIRDLLGLQGELADHVEKRSAGNPLFAVQLVGDWVNRGLLESSDRGFKLKDDAEVLIPDNLHEVWSSAIGPILTRCPENARVTLELAATLGQRVEASEWSTLCALAQAPPPESATDACVEAGMLRPTSTGWRFVHAMLRESLERTAREEGRWASHNLACANMLRDRYPDRPNAIAGRLGRHLLIGGQVEPALDLLLTGAQTHAEASEYSQALDLVDQHDRALDQLAARADEPHRIEGWLLRARVYLQQGRPHLAQAWAERAASKTREVPDPTLRAAALARLGDVYHLRGEVDRAERRYLAALPKFREAEDWVGVGDCLQGLSQLAERRGRFDRARELFGEARAAYAVVNAPLQLATCIDRLANVHRKMGNLTEARTLSEEALARHEGLGSASGVAASTCRLAVLDLIEGDPRAATAHFTSALTLYERIGDPMGQAYCFNGLAETARFRDDLEAAETGYRRAIQIGETLGTGERLMYRLNLALVVLRQRRFEQARMLLEDAMEKLEVDGRHALVAGAHIGLMTCAAALGDLSSFELHFQLARRLSQETGMVDPDAAWPAEMAGELLLERGYTDWGRACLELALIHWSALGRKDDEDRVRTVLKRKPA